MVILTQTELREVFCDQPDCGHQELTMVPKCHPTSGFLLRYDKDTCVLTAQCSRCQDIAAQFAIADKH